MKILYVITGLGQGGAERVVCDLANKMFEKGHEVKIAYLTGDVLTRPKYDDIELININMKSTMSLPSAFLKLSKVIKVYNPNVVHSHMVHANLITRLTRLVLPIEKLISTAHNSNEGGVVRMIGYRSTHHLSNITTNVSKDAVTSFENMKAVPKNGMKVIYNGIDLDKFRYNPKSKIYIMEKLNIDKNCQIILVVGRFNEQKDYPNLLHAISLLKQRSIYPFKLLIVGDGELRELIEQLIDSLGLQEDVILLGRRDDIPNLMSAADLFVLSSKYEGFGLVVAEAMACECLVVATDCGGVAEVLNNPEFLVPVNNAKALMKKILFTLKLDKSRKDSIVHQNLKHVQDKFSLDNIIEKWVLLYNEK